jgi:hypothetical protein
MKNSGWLPPCTLIGNRQTAIKFNVVNRAVGWQCTRSSQ